MVAIIALASVWLVGALATPASGRGGSGVERSLNRISLGASSTSHTWAGRADFAPGAFQRTDIVSDSVRLARQWDTDVRANDDIGSANQNLPSLATGTDGTLYVAWQDSRNTSFDIYFAKSTDGGATWLTNTNVISETGTDNQYDPS